MTVLQAGGGDALFVLVPLGLCLLAAGAFGLGRIERGESVVGGRPAPGLRGCGWAAIAVGTLVVAVPLLQLAAPEAGWVTAGGGGPGGAAAPRGAAAEAPAYQRGAVAAAREGYGPPPPASARARRLSPLEAGRLRRGEALRGLAGPGAPRWFVFAPDEGDAVARVGVAVEAGGAVVAQVLDSAHRSVATFPAAAGGLGVWTFRPDGGDYRLVVHSPDDESRFVAWLD